MNNSTNNEDLLLRLTEVLEEQAGTQNVTYLDPKVATRVPVAQQIQAALLLNSIKSKPCIDYLTQAPQITIQLLEQVIAVDKFLSSGVSAETREEITQMLGQPEVSLQTVVDRALLGLSKEVTDERRQTVLEGMKAAAHAEMDSYKERAYQEVRQQAQGRVYATDTIRRFAFTILAVAGLVTAINFGAKFVYSLPHQPKAQGTETTMERLKYRQEDGKDIIEVGGKKYEIHPLGQTGPQKTAEATPAAPAKPAETVHVKIPPEAAIAAITYIHLQDNPNAAKLYQNADSTEETNEEGITSNQKLEEKVRLFDRVINQYPSTMQALLAQNKVSLMTSVYLSLFGKPRAESEIEQLLNDFNNTDGLTTSFVCDAVNRYFGVELASPKRLADATTTTVSWMAGVAQSAKGTSVGYDINYLLAKVAAQETDIESVYAMDSATVVSLDPRLTENVSSETRSKFSASEVLMRSANGSKALASRGKFEQGKALFRAGQHEKAVIALSHSIAYAKDEGTAKIALQWLPDAYLFLSRAYTQLGDAEYGALQATALQQKFPSSDIVQHPGKYGVTFGGR